MPLPCVPREHQTHTCPQIPALPVPSAASLELGLGSGLEICCPCWAPGGSRIPKGARGLRRDGSGQFAATARRTSRSPKSKRPGAKRRAESCNRLCSLSYVTRPFFFLPVSFGFYRRKAWVTLSPAALLWARRNKGWRSSTGGHRQGRVSGSKAKGRQSRRKASDHSDKAKRL